MTIALCCKRYSWQLTHVLTQWVARSERMQFFHALHLFLFAQLQVRTNIYAHTHTHTETARHIAIARICQCSFAVIVAFDFGWIFNWELLLRQFPLSCDPRSFICSASAVGYVAAVGDDDDDDVCWQPQIPSGQKLSRSLHSFFIFVRLFFFFFPCILAFRQRFTACCWRCWLGFTL